ncbi:MAG TPA: S-layer homology domain-containing protein [Soehngenia sp.]|nr:S-layer homology domain-containing protein [Soehngenia sp.]
MKQKIRLFACVLAISVLGQTVLASQGITSLAETASTVVKSEIFTDIDGHWAKSTIEKFAQKDWVKGYEDRSFKPDKKITRSEFAALVVRQFDCLNPNAKCQFSDVKIQDWFYTVVATSSEAKYLVGYPDGTFRPNAFMSRQEIAVFLSKVLNISSEYKNEIKHFADQDKFPQWSFNSIMALVSHNIIKGYPDNTFRHENPITRAEALVMLDMSYEYSQGNIIIEDEIIPGAIVTPTSSNPAIKTPALTSVPTLLPTTPKSSETSGNSKSSGSTGGRKSSNNSDGESPVNNPPKVNAGSDQKIKLPSGILLKADVKDDKVGGTETIIKWEKVKGEGEVVFENANMAKTYATFSKAGTYELKVVAFDGQYTVSDNVIIEVLENIADVQIKPLADFKVGQTYFRDPDNDNMATITFEDMSQSLDGDAITQRVWKVAYDFNNDGNFDDENFELIDKGNNIKPVYTTNKVGNYKAQLTVTEATYEESKSFNGFDTVSKTFTVDNKEPEAVFDVQKKKKVDVIFTVARADANKIDYLTTAIEGFKKRCEENGIDAKISTVSTQSLTASDTFAWDTYDHYNYVDSYGPTLPNHITINGKDIKMIGYTVAPLKDFLFVNDTNKTQKTFTFDIKRDETDWHSMEGGGFLFNAFIKDGKLSGFCILITQEGMKLDELSNVDVKKFVDGSYNYVENAGKKLSTFSIKNPYDNHNLKIIVDPDRISIWDNGEVIVENYELPKNDYGSGFGPIISHASHACGQMSYFTFKNIKMTTVLGKSLSEVLDDPDWRVDAERFVVNLSEDKIYELISDDKTAEVAMKLLKNSVKFIGMGTNDNKSQYENVINAIAGDGLYLDNTNINNAMDDLEKYILNNINQKDYGLDRYLEQGQEILYTKLNKDYENDPIYQQQWKYNHTPSVLENDIGIIDFDGEYLENPVTVFDKTGEYKIFTRVEDNPVSDNDAFSNFRKWSDENLSQKTLIVNRKPIGEVEVTLVLDESETFYLPSVSENSYDLDHKSELDSGIVLREYKWKKVTDTAWTDGNLPDKLDLNEKYILFFRVKDKEGAYSLPVVKLIDTETGIVSD